MAREAKSLQQLEKEIQSIHPGTTTWEKGDSAHQSTWSDHNANDAGVYCAKDILSDGGLDLALLVYHLTNIPHPSLRYVIYKRKIYQRKNNFAAQTYHGVIAHETHVHVSVGNGPDGRSTSNYDNSASWGIADVGSGTPSTPKPKPPTSDWTDKLMANLPQVKRGSKGAQVKVAQALLNTAGAGLKEDSDFGPKTDSATRVFQRAKGLAVDGIIGKNTWTRLVKR